MKKFLLYTFIYIIATILAIAGTIAMDFLLPHGKDNNGTIETPQEYVETDGEKLINSLMNVGSTNVNLQFNVYDNTMSEDGSIDDKQLQMIVQFDGSLSIEDLENIKISGTLSAKLKDNTNIIIDIVYVDKALYLANETMSIKLEDASFNKILELLPSLGLNMNFGVDISTLDTDTLLANLQNIKAKTLANGDLLMAFKLNDDIVIDICTDSNYVIKSLTTNKLEFSSVSASINAELIKDDNITIENPEKTKEYVDVTKTLNIVDSVREILENKKLHLNIDANLDSDPSFALVGGIDIDYNDNLDAYGSFDIDLNGTTHKVTIGYVNEEIYLSLNNLKFMIDQNNIEETVAIIAEYFDISQAQENLLVSIAKIIPGFELSKVLEGDLSNISINNLLAFAKGEDNVINITLYGKAIGIQNDLNIVLRLDENDQFSSMSISNIKVLDGLFSANISYSNEVNIPDLASEDYQKLLDIPNFVNSLLNSVDIIKAKNYFSADVAIKLNINGNIVGVNGNIGVDFADQNNIKVVLLGNITYDSKTIDFKLKVVNDQICVIVEDMKFSASISKMESVIEELTKRLGDNSAISGAMEELAQKTGLISELIKGNIDKIPQDLIVDFSSQINQLSTTINKDLLGTKENIIITINYDNTIDGLQLSKIDIMDQSIETSVNITNTAVDYDFDQHQYTKLDNIGYLVNSVFNLIDQINEEQKIGLELNTSIVLDDQEIELNGVIVYNFNDIYFNAVLDIDGNQLPIMLYRTNNNYYIEFAELKLCIPTDDISSVINHLTNYPRINNMLGKLVKINNIDFTDVATKVLSIFKQIEIGQNQTRLVINGETIGLNDNIILQLHYNNIINSLSICNINYQDITIQADITINNSLTVPTISGVYSYIDTVNDITKALISTTEQVVRNKKIAFSVYTTMTVDTIDHTLNGVVAVDWSNINSIDNFEFRDLMIYASVHIDSILLVLRVEDGYAYIDYNNKQVKIQLNSVLDILGIVSNLTDIDLLGIQGINIEDLITKIDVSKIDFTILKSITATKSQINVTISNKLLNTAEDIKVSISYENNIKNIKITNFELNNVAISMDLKTLYNFVPMPITESNYRDISDIKYLVNSAINTYNEITNSNNATFSISGLNIALGDKNLGVNGIISVDMDNISDIANIDFGQITAYANLNIDINNKSFNTTVYLMDKCLYISVDDLKFSINIDSIGDLTTVVGKIIYVIQNADSSQTIEELYNNYNGTSLDAIIDQITGSLDTFDITKVVNTINQIIDYINIVSIDKNTMSINVNDVTLTIAYDELIRALTINDLQLDDVCLDCNIKLLYNFTIPEISNISDYKSVNNIAKFVDSICRSLAKIIDNKQLTLNLGTIIRLADNKTESTYTIAIYDNSSITIDWSKASSNETIGLNTIDLQASINAELLVETINSTGILDTTRYTINLQITKLSDKLYITLNNKSIMINVDTIGRLVDQILNIIGANNNTNNQLSNIDLNAMLQSIGLNMLHNFIVSDTQLELQLDLNNWNIKDIVNIIVNYNNSLFCINVSPITMDEFEISGTTISLNYDYNTIVVPDRQYIDLNNLDNLVSAMINTYRNVTDNRTIAFDIDTKVTIGNKAYSINGKIYVDFSNVTDKFSLDDLYVTANMNLDNKLNTVIRLQNGYLLVECLGLKVRVSCYSISDIINNICNIFNINMDNDIADQFANTIIMQIINKDLSSISLSLIDTLIVSNNQTHVSLSKQLINSNNNIDITLDYNELLSSITVDTLYISNISANLRLVINNSYRPQQVDINDFSDLSYISNTISAIYSTYNTFTTNYRIWLNIANSEVKLGDQLYNVTGDIYLDLSNFVGNNNFNYKDIRGCINLQLLDTQQYLHNIAINLDGDRIYLTYNTLSVSVSLDKIDMVVDLVQQFQFLSDSLKTVDVNNVKIQDIINEARTNASLTKDDIDIIQTIKSIITFVDIDAIMSGDISRLDLSFIKSILATNNTFEIVLDKNITNNINDSTIKMYLSDNIDRIKLTDFAFDKVSCNLDINTKFDFEMPQVDKSIEYIDLDNIDTAINSTLNTAIEVVDNKHISFALQTVLDHNVYEKDVQGTILKETSTHVVLKQGSFARFDWNNAYTIQDGKTSFDFKKMNMYAVLNATTATDTYKYTNGVKGSSSNHVERNHTIEITMLDGIIYIQYNNMKVKIACTSIDGVIASICEIMGVDVDTASVSDNINSLIGQVSDTSMLSKLNIEMLKSLKLTDNNMRLQLDLTSLDLGFDALNDFNLDITYDNNGLNQLTINNLNIMNNIVDNVVVELNDFEPITNIPQGEYMDLSGIDQFLEVIKNTITLKDYEINGSVNLKLNVIGITFNENIPVKLKLKITENNKMELNARIGAIPVIPGVNDDTPYIAGNTVSGMYSALNRILNIYIKNDMVYFYRSETVPAFGVKDRTYEKKLMIHMETFASDPLYYLLQYGMGFSSKIMDAIYNAFYKERVNPIDYSNVLKGFTSSNGTHTLTLNLQELTENNQLDTFTLGIKETTYNNKQVVGTILLDMFMPVANNVEITLTSNNLTHTCIGQTINLSEMYNYINGYEYKEGAEWDAYNGEWNIASQRKFKITFVTNCSTTINAVEGVAGASYQLPTLDTYYTEDADNRYTYTFDGWYTSDMFKPDTEYTANAIPKKDIVLYAKWNVTTTKYTTIAFVTNGGETIQDLRALANSTITLPTYFDLLIVETDDAVYTKQFDGWYIDEALTQEFTSTTMPSSNMTLYAKWSVVDTASAYTLTVYEAGEKVLVRKIIAERNIILSGNKFKDTTKYYLDSNYASQIEINNYLMPSQDLNLYIRNIYTVRIISEMGNVVDIIYTDKYTGDVITLMQQSSSEYDDTNNVNTRTYRTFDTFLGYYINDDKLSNNDYVISVNDVTIVAKWQRTIKYYVTITFNVNWVKPGSWQNNNSYFFGKIEERCKATKIDSIKVLQNTDFELLPSVYNSTCVQRYYGGGIYDDYTFKVKSWTLNGTKQLYYNNGKLKNDDYTVQTTFNVAEDTTVFAVWYQVK